MKHGIWGDVLAGKHEHLNLGIQQVLEKLGVEAFNCNLSTSEVEIDLRGTRWAASLGESVNCMFSEEPCIKKA